MKIGILTLPLHVNYGGILQAYALQTVLERMGHNVQVFHKDESYKIKIPPHFPESIKIYSKRFLKKLFIGGGYRIFAEKYYNEEYEITTQKTREFVNKYIHLCKLDSFFEIKQGDFDAIVVGSDQVWRPRYFRNMWKTNVENMFLDFTKNWNIRRIAYAPSFGVDEWEFSSEETNLCKTAIARFDAVSVRENGGKKLCMSFFDTKAEVVLDPTMLLSELDYGKLANQKIETNKYGYLLTYILDFSKETEKLIERISSEKHLSIFNASSKVDCIEAPLKEKMQISVEEWLRGFANAEFVVTDSFHACVFSIIFNKPFVVIGNKMRGMDRFYSLLKKFGLEENMLDAGNTYDSKKTYALHNGVKEILRTLRDDSLRFLTEALNGKM